MSNQLRFGSLLIVTYGRSGSTLLQGILNSIPGCYIRGENNNFAFWLFKAYEAMRLGYEMPYALSSQVPSHPWFGIRDVDFAEMEADIKDLLYHALVPRPLRETTFCYGFKEIRYPWILDSFDAYLDFLRSVMPQTGIIFNFRNIERVMQSAWWKNHNLEQIAGMLRQSDIAFRAYAASHPDVCFCVDYEQVSTKGEQLEQLFAFLGCEFDSDRLDAILEETHSTRSEP